MANGRLSWGESFTQSRCGLRVSSVVVQTSRCLFSHTRIRPDQKIQPVAFAAVFFFCLGRADSNDKQAFVGGESFTRSLIWHILIIVIISIYFYCTRHAIFFQILCFVSISVVIKFTWKTKCNELE